jgi:hypothetical protein
VDHYYYNFIEAPGPDGRVQPVFVAGSHDFDECFEKARKRLKEEFGDSWERVLADSYTGTLAFVGACSPWTEQELREALYEDLVSATGALG